MRHLLIDVTHGYPRRVGDRGGLSRAERSFILGAWYDWQRGTAAESSIVTLRSGEDADGGAYARALRPVCIFRVENARLSELYLANISPSNAAELLITAQASFCHLLTPTPSFQAHK